MNEMTKMNQAASVALVHEVEQSNPFAAFSASSMMMVVKKDLLGLNQIRTSATSGSTF